MRGHVSVFQKTRLPWLRCNHRQTPRSRNRPRDGTTNFTERRNWQNSIHPYLPSTKPSIKNVILKNFKILRNDPEAKHIFSPSPLISFKRDKNLGKFLVRSAFKFNNQPGTFTCKRARCKTCRFISNTVKILGPNRSAIPRRLASSVIDLFLYQLWWLLSRNLSLVPQWTVRW